MPITWDVIRNLRNSPENSVRVLKLSDEERKLAEQPQGKEGEICLLVYGMLTPAGLQVSRITPEEDSSSDETAPSQEIKFPEAMYTMPSPS